MRVGVGGMVVNFGTLLGKGVFGNEANLVCSTSVHAGRERPYNLLVPMIGCPRSRKQEITVARKLAQKDDIGVELEIGLLHMQMVRSWRECTITSTPARPD